MEVIIIHKNSGRFVRAIFDGNSEWPKFTPPELKDIGLKQRTNKPPFHSDRQLPRSIQFHFLAGYGV